MSMNISPPPYYGIKANYGFLHVYALTMTLGIIISFLCCYIKAKKKELPQTSLLFSVIIIVPSALLCASFFGKVNFTHFEWSSFFYYFEFWSPTGGMSIHGSVLGGILSGILYFYPVSKRYNISLWVFLDTILPNVLIGQAIGRWGNFFNHELLGSVTSLQNLSWLPNWISHNCWQNVQENQGNILVPEGWPGPIVYRQPIFLYESFGDIMAWIFITFFLHKLMRMFGPKPWKLYPDKYKTSFRYSYSIKNIFKISSNTNSNKKNKNFIKYKKDNHNLMTYNQIWDDAYYNKKITLNNNSLNLKTSNNLTSLELEKLHNPNKYNILRSGAQAGIYIFLWNIIRFILETQRTSDQLFLHNLRTADYTVILIIAFIGLIIFFITQFYLPKNKRREGWMYEKDYQTFS